MLDRNGTEVRAGDPVLYYASVEVVVAATVLREEGARCVVQMDPPDPTLPVDPAWAVQLTEVNAALDAAGERPVDTQEPLIVELTTVEYAGTDFGGR